ncbi:unnamed protein product [Larinioides sclopetarius]|uniref:Succinate dehydrogenase subunit 4 n=1 Tax=Larinioides sclopetarius TaxID=280406 RepID=A0AAV2A6P5_9ARAC
MSSFDYEQNVSWILRRVTFLNLKIGLTFSFLLFLGIMMSPKYGYLYNKDSLLNSLICYNVSMIVADRDLLSYLLYYLGIKLWNDYSKSVFNFIIGAVAVGIHIAMWIFLTK